MKAVFVFWLLTLVQIVTIGIVKHFNIWNGIGAMAGQRMSFERIAFKESR